MFKSIRTKFVVAQIGFVLAVTVVLGLITYFIMFGSLRNSRLQYLDYVTLHAEQEINTMIVTRQQLLEKIADSEMVKGYVRKQSENILLGYFDRFMSEFDVLSYVNEQGIEEVKLVNGEIAEGVLDEADSVLIERLRRSPNRIMHAYVPFSPEINGPCLEFGILKRNFFDEFVGIILGKVSVEKLSETIHKNKVGGAGFVILLDSQGTILSCKDRGKILKKIVIDGAGAGTTEAVKTGGSGFGRANILGVDSYFAYGNTYKQNWVVIAAMPYSEFAAELNHLRNTMMLVGFNVLVAGVILSLLLARDMTGPVLKLVRGTSLIAKGDFAHKINVASQDEIGTLARSFNKMAENLGKTTTSITNLNREITVREKVEASLRNSEKRFKEVAENSGDWIWEINAEGLYTYSSPVVEKILGYKPVEICGKKYFYDFFVLDQKEELKKKAFEVFARQEEFNGLVNFNVHKDGRTVILETYGTPIINEQGKLCGYRGVDRDITKRKQAEEQLLAVNALQEFFLQPIPIEQKLKYVTDTVLRVLDADFVRVWTIKPGDRCESGCIHARETEGPHVCRFRDKCLHLMASSGRYTHIDGEVHRRVPFGCYKIGLVASGEDDKFLTNEAATDPRVHNHDWVKELGLVSFAGYRLMHTDGKRLGVLALFSKHPVSPQEDAFLEGIAHSTSVVIHTSNAEAELRKNEEFTKRIIESSNDCIKVLDLQGNLFSMSAGGQKLLEIDDITPYLNVSFVDFWKGKEREYCLKAVEKAKRGGTGVFFGYHETAKGTPKWWDVAITPIKDTDGSISRLLAVSRDITERKMAEQALEKLNKDLESTVALLTQSNRQLREFAHLTAHDLKTPLRGINTLAQWLVQDYGEKLDDKAREQVNLLMGRVERLNGLVNAILQYSTITRARYKERPCNLNMLIEDIIVKINPPPSIKITISRELPTVMGIEAHLRQVFYHLISNAVKFMDKPQGQITIGYTDKNDRWEFSVSDNGPGIEPQHFDRVFQLFQTLSDHDQSEGIGTGLTFARKIVELYGGQIWLSSELGQGSTFFFTLPKTLSNTNDKKVLLSAST